MIIVGVKKNVVIFPPEAKEKFMLEWMKMCLCKLLRRENKVAYLNMMLNYALILF